MLLLLVWEKEWEKRERERDTVNMEALKNDRNPSSSLNHTF